MVTVAIESDREAILNFFEILGALRKNPEIGKFVSEELYFDAQSAALEAVTGEKLPRQRADDLCDRITVASAKVAGSMGCLCAGSGAMLSKLFDGRPLGVGEVRCVMLELQKDLMKNSLANLSLLLSRMSK